MMNIFNRKNYMVKKIMQKIIIMINMMKDLLKDQKIMNIEKR